MALTIPAAPVADIVEGVTVVGKNTSIAAAPDATEQAALDAEKALATPARPSYLPEGFDTPEALAEAFTALKATQAAPPPVPTAPKAGVLAITTPAEAAALASAKGVDLDALSSEFASTGELSAASLSLLESKGIAKTVVDSYIAGQQAAATLVMQELAAHVGGPDELTALMQWSATGLQPSEITAFNGLLSMGNMDTSKFALSGLKAQMESALGTMPIFITGKGGPANAGIQPFASQAEVTAIMRTPGYHNDPAIRDAVARRLEVTTAF